MKAFLTFCSSVALMISSSSCDNVFGLPGQIRDLDNKVSDTNGSLVNTNANTGDLDEKARLQALDDAIKEMTDPNNTMSLSAPVLMMPAAKVFDQYVHCYNEKDPATQLNDKNEFMQYVGDIWMRDINDGTPDLALQNPDGSWPASLITQVDNHKNTERTIITLVASFLSQDQVRKIISEQIDGQGKYQLQAYQVLMFRYLGIETFFLDENDFVSLNDENSLATIQDAYAYLRDLDFINALPYADKMTFPVIGMLDPSLNVTMRLEASDLNYPKNSYKTLLADINKLPQSVLESDAARSLKSAVQSHVQ